MMKMIYIRGEVVGENPAGQKRIHLLANNADGIYFWTDERSIVRPEELTINGLPQEGGKHDEDS